MSMQYDRAGGRLPVSVCKYVHGLKVQSYKPHRLPGYRPQVPGARCQSSGSRCLSGRAGRRASSFAHNAACSHLHPPLPGTIWPAQYVSTLPVCLSTYILPYLTSPFFMPGLGSSRPRWLPARHGQNRANDMLPKKTHPVRPGQAHPRLLFCFVPPARTQTEDSTRQQARNGPASNNRIHPGFQTGKLPSPRR